MRIISSLLLGLVMMISSVQLHAQNTKIMVRAKAKDAKFVGSSIGGAQIYIKNAMTDELLAKGVTAGSTGNTKVIMQQAHQRHQRLSDAKTAGFLANLQLDKPTLLTIEAHSPLQARQARVVSSTQIWAIPNKDILGDGIMLEIPGFIVDVLLPQRHQKLEADTDFTIKANITMMCGCTISKGGLWNAEDYEVKALFYNQNKLIKSVSLQLGESVNTFVGHTALTSGNYTLVIYAYDAVTGNTGVDKTNIIIKN